MKTYFHSNGKLLLTAEYFVLDGAKALALPSTYGQTLTVQPLSYTEIHWKSFDRENKLWFSGDFKIYRDKIISIREVSAKHERITVRLEQILSELQNLNPSLFQRSGFSIETRLEFPQNWGLGSSSTLISNLANWAQVDPYVLLSRTFGGSGYDIACAQQDSPLIYRLQGLKNPTVETVNFDPPFKNELFFVYLNQKQNSREGIDHYKQQDLSRKKNWVAQVSRLTEEILYCQDVVTFERLLEEHEHLLSSILKLPGIKKSRFPDYPKALKSLGAWGGDFILAIGGEAEKAYFRSKNYRTLIDYHAMILGH